MTRITQRGQVTIPARVREQLGLHEGTELEVTVERQEIRLRKVSEQDPLDRWTGALNLPTDVDTFMDDLRGDA